MFKCSKSVLIGTTFKSKFYILGTKVKLPHGHIYSQKNNQAYPQAFILLGEEIQIESVEEPSKEENLTVGVITATKNIVNILWFVQMD